VVKFGYPKKKEQIKMCHAFVVVDMQNDFCGGSLPVPGARDAVPVIEKASKKVRELGGIVVFSMDLHEPGARHFDEWPVHCVRGTEGAKFAMEVPGWAHIIEKGMKDDDYSVFDGVTQLDGIRLLKFLHQKKVTSLTIGGVALDVCAKATSLDGRKFGFPTNVLLPACKAVTEEGGKEAIDEMARNGVLVFSSFEEWESTIDFLYSRDAL